MVITYMQVEGKCTELYNTVYLKLLVGMLIEYDGFRKLLEKISNFI